jgi:hypothetical protein
MTSTSFDSVMIDIEYDFAHAPDHLMYPDMPFYHAILFRCRLLFAECQDEQC